MASGEKQEKGAEVEKVTIDLHDLGGLANFHSEQQMARMNDEKRAPEERVVHERSFYEKEAVKGVLDSLINEGIQSCEGALLELNNRLQGDGVSNEDKLILVEVIKFVEQNQDSLPKNYKEYQKEFKALRDKYIS